MVHVIDPDWPCPKLLSLSSFVGWIIAYSYRLEDKFPLVITLSCFHRIVTSKWTWAGNWNFLYGRWDINIFFPAFGLKSPVGAYSRYSRCQMFALHRALRIKNWSITFVVVSASLKFRSVEFYSETRILSYLPKCRVPFATVYKLNFSSIKLLS